MDNFRSDLSQQCEILLQLPELSVDNLVTRFNNVLRATLDKHAPATEKSTRSRPNNPWYDEEIHTARQVRRRFERRWKQSKSQHDLDAFLQQRTQFNYLLDTKKSQYFQQIISDNHGNQKQLFRIFQQLCNKKLDTPLPNHDSGEQLANDFATFFSAKITRINETFIPANYDVESHFVRPTTFSFTEIAEDKLQKLYQKHQERPVYWTQYPRIY